MDQQFEIKNFYGFCFAEGEEEMIDSFNHKLVPWGLAIIQEVNEFAKQ